MRVADDKDLCALLDKKGIPYKLYSHDPVFTVGESKGVTADLPGTGIKNLYLKDKHGHGYLVILKQDKRLAIKMLASQLGSGRLSFAKADALYKDLGVTPGSVNPFCMLNSIDNLVTPVVDNDLRECEEIAAHPMRNDYTVVIKGFHLWRLMEKESVPLCWTTVESDDDTKTR